MIKQENFELFDETSMNFARERMLGISAVLVASVLWGTTGTAATFAPSVSAAAIGSVAMGLGGLLQALVAVKSIARGKKYLLDQWRFLLLGAVAVAIYPVAFYGSMRIAGVTIGTVVSIGSAPLLSILIEYWLDGIQLTLRWLVGAILGVTGIILPCLAESNYGGDDSSPEVIIGILLGIVAALTYATYSWSARRLMQSGIPSQAAMGATFGIGGILLMPVLFLTGAPLLASWENAAVGAYMALVPMFLGYICFGYGLARIQASTATTITLFEPVVAAVLAVVIIGETLPGLGWTGIGLVVGCLIFITLPVKKSTDSFKIST